MKLSVIGGGGVRSPLLARSIARRAAEIGIDSVSFMDIDAEKLAVFGALSRRVAAAVAPELAFHLTTDLDEAVRGAQFIITTMRAGGDDSRARDERIALEHGLIGQETTGAGGFAMALRSVPAVSACCRAAAAHAAPHAVILNFTNPAGLVTQAMRDEGFERVYGICDAPSSLLRQVAPLLGRRPEEIDCVCQGLNHLSFFTRMRLDGKDVLPRLLDDPRLFQWTDMRFFEPALARRLGVLPNEYLYYYFSSKEAGENMRRASKTRGESICDINSALMRELAALPAGSPLETAAAVFEKWVDMRERSYMAGETGRQSRDEPFRFDVHAEDDGGYAGVALAFVAGAAGRGRGEMTLNLGNGTSLPWLEPDDVVELTCTVDAGGVHAKQAGPLPLAAQELVRRVKVYERAASAAIRARDRDAAVDALFLHPLVGSYSAAASLVDRFLDAHVGTVGRWS